MITRSRHPSLRRRLLLNLLVPGAVLAVAFGAGGSIIIHGIVQRTHDRLLDGSLLAIADRLGVDGGEVTVDLPPAALGMLESQAQDSIYYSIRYNGELVRPVPDLPLPDPTNSRPTPAFIGVPPTRSSSQSAWSRRRASSTANRCRS